MIPHIRQFIEEKKIWKVAGKPVRSDERVEELFNVCSANKCGNYISLMANLGQCGVCSCLLRKHGNEANKLRWATTRCPLPEPLWIEEEGYEQPLETKEEPEPEPVIEPPQGPDPHRGTGGQTGGCGCG